MVEITSDWTENELTCANCEEINLHQCHIEIFECEEDATVGLHIISEGFKLNTETDISGNPSRRRNGMFIDFWCEWCEMKTRLKILQHKGTTFMSKESIQEEKNWKKKFQ